jgi:hydroxymethylpyrimidine/phosphomethylpyrimidine kinase
LEIIFDEFRILGVKIGMMGNRAIAGAIADVLEKNRPPQVVLDPIFKSTTGVILNDDMTFNVIKERIFPYTTVITPNSGEAKKLLGNTDKNISPTKMAVEMHEKYNLKSVIITGNEGKASSFDLVYDGENTNIIQTKYIKAKNNHGTGCRHSSALTYYLSKGIFLNESALLAKDYVLDYLSGQK